MLLPFMSFMLEGKTHQKYVNPLIYSTPWWLCLIVVKQPWRCLENGTGSGDIFNRYGVRESFGFLWPITSRKTAVGHCLLSTYLEVIIYGYRLWELFPPNKNVSNHREWWIRLVFDTRKGTALAVLGICPFAGLSRLIRRLVNGAKTTVEFQRLNCQTLVLTSYRSLLYT